MKSTAVERTVIEGARFFGPGRVTALLADRIELAIPSESATPVRDGAAPERIVEARNALAWPYEPMVGDELLVAGGGAAFFVIGVLRGSGTTQLAFDGDLELYARGGELRLAADRGVRIDAPEVAVRSQAFHVVAEAATQIVGTLRHTVRELFALRAKEHVSQVEGNVLSQAKSMRMVSEDKVTLNGKEIFLG